MIRITCPHVSALHPFCWVLPPHMLDKIEANGSPQQKQWARRTALHTATLRGQRHVLEQALMPVRADGRRTVYDADHATVLPGKVIRGETDAASDDPAINEAFDCAGDVRTFYLQVFNRNSVDGRGMRLDSTVHYGEGYDNAFWNGQQMTYGDGDADLFNRFTLCLDVIGHELTHGVTQFTAGLAYQDQPGALNESMSDVFGSMVKQFKLGQSAAEADWLIGAGLFTARVKGKALRSMLDPGTAYDDPVLGKDPQPAHMRDYVETSDDSGGVHINSGIPNRAFALAAKAIGGRSWEITGKVWYETLTRRLDPNADFRAAAVATADVARAYGTDVAAKVREAWQAVGISA